MKSLGLTDFLFEQAPQHEICRAMDLATELLNGNLCPGCRSCEIIRYGVGEARFNGKVSCVMHQWLGLVECCFILQTKKVNAFPAWKMLREIDRSMDRSQVHWKGASPYIFARLTSRKYLQFIRDVYKGKYEVRINVGLTGFNLCVADEYCRHCDSYPVRRAEALAYTSRIAVRKQVFGIHGKKCKRCGDTKHLQLDHIVPVVRGGVDEISNLQPLCRSCNAKKGAKKDFDLKNPDHRENQ